MITSVYESPCGRLLLGSEDSILCICDWIDGKHANRLPHFEEGSSDIIRMAAAQLDEYFAAKRTEFDIPLRISGTPFQNTIWRELLSIPYGQTLSYGGLASRIRRPSAVRPVANAIGANPLSIFIPCHRIIAADGSLTGYAGGLSAKGFLLRLEKSRINVPSATQFQSHIEDGSQV